MLPRFVAAKDARWGTRFLSDTLRCILLLKSDQLIRVKNRCLLITVFTVLLNFGRVYLLISISLFLLCFVNLSRILHLLHPFSNLHCSTHSILNNSNLLFALATRGVIALDKAQSRIITDRNPAACRLLHYLHWWSTIAIVSCFLIAT